MRQCQCKNGACDPTTGECQCEAGWTGLRCDRGELRLVLIANSSSEIGTVLISHHSSDEVLCFWSKFLDFKSGGVIPHPLIGGVRSGYFDYLPSTNVD